MSESRHGSGGRVTGPSSSSATVVRSNHAALRAVCREVRAAKAEQTELDPAQLREVIEANGADFDALAADRVPLRLRPGGRLEVA